VGIDLASWFDRLPGSTVYVPDPGVALAACATLVGAYWLRRGHWRDLRTWLVTLIVIAWAVMRLGPGTALPRETLLRVDALAVGSGTCLLVRSADDAMLWDCGSTNPYVGRRLVPDAVRALGAGRVRTAIVTHANYDHYCGLPDVMQRLGVRTVLVGPSVATRSRNQPNSMMARAVEAIEDRGAHIRVLTAGDSFTLGRAHVEIISPPADALHATDNDNSLVALVTVRDKTGRPMRAMLTGDIEAPAIEWLLASGGDLHVQAMEAPHHASAKEALLAFVAEANPGVVLQSSNLDRATDARLQPAKRHRRWRSTALEGATWVELRADSTVRSGSHATRPVTDPAWR
jgi:competence protein ComEC